MDTLYPLHILHSEQSRPSIATQCVNLLKHLDNVVDEVFSSILTRIDDYSSEMKSLQQRAQILNAKVSKLENRSTASVVLSSPAFPGHERYIPFTSFVLNENLSSYVEKIDTIFEPLKYNSSQLKDKLDFFHSPIRHQRTIGKNEGLGKMPGRLTSVNSLLLYNTTHNPYRNDCIYLDPLEASSVTTTRDKENENLLTPSLEDPSVSNEDDKEYNAYSKDELEYLPELSDLPELDLPFELPFLPGIANDLSYMEGEGVSIAPSIRYLNSPRNSLTSPISLDSSTTFAVPNSPTVSVVKSTFRNSEPKSEVMVVSAPEASSKRIEKVDARPLLPPSSDVLPIPPPPPPPAPPPPPTLPSVGSESEIPHKQIINADSSIPTATAAPAEPSSDCRMNLMKAIQEAGGVGKAKLRRVTAPDAEGSKKNRNVGKASFGPGDLMADLSAKLSQRRKGIAGNASSAKNINTEQLLESVVEDSPFLAGHPTLSKISSIIPSPSLHQETDSEGNGDQEDDWD